MYVWTQSIVYTFVFKRTFIYPSLNSGIVAFNKIRGSCYMYSRLGRTVFL